MWPAALLDTVPNLFQRTTANEVKQFCTETGELIAAGMNV